MLQSPRFFMVDINLIERYFNMEKRLTFNESPESYERLRPKYPENLIEDIIKYSALSIDSKILEIGPGTGQITFPFAKRGYHITGIEIGENLFRYLQKKLINYSNVSIINNSFEEWDSKDNNFDLVISAQAFHWIDPKISYPKVAKLLKSKGKLALIWIYHPTTDIINELDRIYEKCFPDYKKLEDVELKISKQIEEISAAEQFENLKVYRYPFEIEYNPSQYIDLLDTYSDHKNLNNQIKSQLYNEIKNIINSFGGKIRKPYIATLYYLDKKN